jgi:hypothetical protein
MQVHCDAQQNLDEDPPRTEAWVLLPDREVLMSLRYAYNFTFPC